MTQKYKAGDLVTVRLSKNQDELLAVLDMSNCRYASNGYDCYYKNELERYPEKDMEGV